MNDVRIHFRNHGQSWFVALLLAVALVAWLVTPTIVGQEQFDGIPAAQQEPDDGETEPTIEGEVTTETVVDSLPIETFQVFLSRDPFEPVLPEIVSGGGGGGDGNGGPGDPGGPGGGDGGNGGTGSDPLCEDAGAQATCEGLTVTLIDVIDDQNGPRIIVQVEDTLYEVTVGSVFAGSFRVLAITPPCADLLFGDDTFTLCQGDRVLK